MHHCGYSLYPGCMQSDKEMTGDFKVIYKIIWLGDLYELHTVQMQILYVSYERSRWMFMFKIRWK